MNDPYRTLGISPEASDDEVKKAYRELARKYHPDNYHNNPLADLAQEKMKDINEAYEAIQKMRAGGNRGSSGYSQGGYSQGEYSSQGYSGGAFSQVRAALNNGNVALAERLLNQISDRNAEWYFLMGNVYMSKGWFDDGMTMLKKAVDMDPNNPEYAQGLAYAQQNGMRYTPGGFGLQGGDALCRICSTLMCMNMFCRC